MAGRDSGQHEHAVEFAKQAIRHHPRSDWIWRELGNELITIDRLDEAEKSLNNARNLNPGEEWLWRYIVKLRRKQKNLEGEIEALEKLHALDLAKATDLNQLGIAYHNSKPPDFAKALKFYRLAATTDPNTAYFFNMGLVFSRSEVSQYVDAADAYRRALALQPDYAQAKEQLEVTKRKLITLGELARCEAAGLIQPDEFFQFYVSPFEALQIDTKPPAHHFEVDAQSVAKVRLPPGRSFL